MANTNEAFHIGQEIENELARMRRQRAPKPAVEHNVPSRVPQAEIDQAVKAAARDFKKICEGQK